MVRVIRWYVVSDSLVRVILSDSIVWQWICVWFMTVNLYLIYDSGSLIYDGGSVSDLWWWICVRLWYGSDTSDLHSDICQIQWHIRSKHVLMENNIWQQAARKAWNIPVFGRREMLLGRCNKMKDSFPLTHNHSTFGWTRELPRRHRLGSSTLYWLHCIA